MDLSTFYVQFKEETADNVRTITDGLLTLERSPGDRATLDSVFRAAHTVKGSARLLGFGQVANLGHAMESLLGALRTGTLTLSSPLSDLLLQANDMLLVLATAASESQNVDSDPAELINRLERAASGTVDDSTSRLPPAEPASSPDQPRASNAEPRVQLPEPVPSTSTASDAPVSRPPFQQPASARPTVSSAPTANVSSKASRATVRVRVDRLDRLVAVAGELTVAQQEDGVHLQQLQTLNTLLTQQQRILQVLEGELHHVRFSPSQRQSVTYRMNELLTNGNELRQIARTQQEAYTRRAAATTLLVDELEAEVFAARLVPVATLFATLPRAVRELSRGLNKQVELELQGEETEADRKVLDALNDPLLHMVRNALDHGLEAVEERLRVGKPPAGKVTIAATADQGQIILTVTDDGRGMDSAALRATAVRKGLLDEQAAAAIDDDEAMELIFAPGFSTSQIITDVSGRGVGMDVVRSRMIELGGQVLVQSKLGEGTTITLVLPVSLMTSKVLLVEAGQQLWALPARSCQGLLRLDRDVVRRIEGQPLLQVEGKTVPLLTLADLLDLPATPFVFNGRSHALLIGASRPIAVLVERLVDEREVVIKPLGPLFPAHPLAAGIAPLPDGSLVVVLSAQGLLNRSRRTRGAALGPKRSSQIHRLLITDDSFTTRELLRSILQSAGYDVTTAVDGQDALDKLRADNHFDLVVSDVEMPRLDGFGLTSSIRADPALTHLPVIIVTSLHTDEHKRQGILAGAQAYIVKSQFDQSNLLAAIRDLVGSTH
jgi:two-component system chemotaxis sensor kinase CheA